jgi:hypothetical protein
VKHVDAQAAARAAVALAAREIERMSAKTELAGWDSAELERYAGICLRYDHHELTWMNKVDPGKCNDELLRRVLAATDTEEGEADGARAKRAKRTAA